MSEAPKTWAERFAEKLNSWEADVFDVPTALEEPISGSTAEIASIAKPISDVDPSPNAAARNRDVARIFGQKHLGPASEN